MTINNKNMLHTTFSPPNLVLPVHAFVVVLALCSLLAPFPAASGPIDLNDFFADPTAEVATDGSWALLREDTGSSFVLLANDPWLGDPEVIIAAPGLSLFFDYDFNEPLKASLENDEFGAFIIDADTGLSAGTEFEHFEQTTSAGTVEFELSSLVGTTLGLQFQLSSLFGDVDLGSEVLIMNVRLDATTVPEPSTLALLMVGGLGLAASRRRRRA